MAVAVYPGRCYGDIAAAVVSQRIGLLRGVAMKEMQPAQTASCDALLE